MSDEEPFWEHETYTDYNYDAANEQAEYTAHCATCGWWSDYPTEYEGDAEAEGERHANDMIELQKKERATTMKLKDDVDYRVEFLFNNGIIEAYNVLGQQLVKFLIEADRKNAVLYETPLEAIRINKDQITRTSIGETYDPTK